MFPFEIKTISQKPLKILSKFVAGKALIFFGRKKTPALCGSMISSKDPRHSSYMFILWIRCSDFLHLSFLLDRNALHKDINSERLRDESDNIYHTYTFMSYVVAFSLGGFDLKDLLPGCTKRSQGSAKQKGEAK